MTNALDDAREHLESCVASLRDGTSTGTAHNDPNSTQDIVDAPALCAYERFRRELGLALRECERGREPLLELLRPPSADEDEEDRVPDFGLDAESSDSDKDASQARSPPPFSLSPSPLSSVRTDAVLVQEKQQRQQQGDDEEDAATLGDVLVVGLERLPPPGIEQVFEADANVDDDNRAHRRPRPRLSRAERIAAAKARRAATTAADVSASGLGLSVIAVDHGGEDDTIYPGAEKQQSKRWGGPGGDVVQELKDVIWKVGEQRRLREEKMQQQQQVVAGTGTEAAVSVASGDNTDNTVDAREPSPLSTVEDVFTSPPELQSLPPTNIT